MNRPTSTIVWGDGTVTSDALFENQKKRSAPSQPGDRIRTRTESNFSEEEMPLLVELERIAAARRAEKLKQVEICSDKSESGETTPSLDFKKMSAVPDPKNTDEPDDLEQKQYTQQQINEIRKASARADRWFMEVEGLNPKENEDKAVLIAARSVGAKTRMQYISHYRQLRKNGHPISYRGLRNYLMTKQGQMNTSSLVHWMAAVNFYHEIYDLMDDGGKTQLHRVNKGLRNQAEISSLKPRGGIEHAKATEIIELGWLPEKYRDYFILLHATGVRGNQLARLKLNDFTLSKDEKFYYVVVQRNHKGIGRASQKKAPPEIHKTFEGWTEEITRILQALRQSSKENNPWVAEHFNATTANIYVKRGAVELKWTTDLVWVVHGFRHGRAIDAQKEGLGKEDEERMLIMHDATGHETNVMMEHYGRENQGRILKAKAAQAKQYKRNAETKLQLNKNVVAQQVKKN
jgi:integrase